VASLQPEDKAVAHVDLRDGRVIDLQTTVSGPRPKLVLLSKSALSDSGPSAIRLGGPNQLPLKGRLSFSFRSENPKKFPRSEKIELATADGSAHVMLSLSDGSLTLQDSQSVLAVFDPVKSLGPSAFGELRFPAVTSDGRKSDWQPLATLVRLPELKEVRCPASPDQPCKLVGSSLFLISSVASDAEFAHSAAVPEGFADSSLSVPRPNGTLLFLKLRDDPSVVSTAALPV